MTATDDVIIVGGGLSGLACALGLHAAGRRPRVLESAPEVGGRLRTDRKDGFAIDRGFAVLLAGYPEVRRVFDLEALRLGSFLPGALVRRHGRFHRLADPRRRPGDVVGTLRAPVGGLGDKLALLGLTRRLGRLPRHGDRPPSVAAFLADSGLSQDMVEGLLRPLLGGVLLDRSLETSADRLARIWPRLAAGPAALPAGGMGALARQLADRLPVGSVETGAPVAAVRGRCVEMAGGGTRLARHVVVAADGPSSARLLGRSRTAPWRSVTHLAFAADTAPIDGPWLVLDGTGEGPVNDLCVPSLVADGYAPAGRHLVSASVLGDHEHVEGAVRRQLTSWFGLQVSTWSLLSERRIRWAVPVVPPGERAGDGCAIGPGGVVVCGDHLGEPSIDGALTAGRRAAEVVLQEWPSPPGRA